MSELTLRLPTGRPLTNQEVDDNFSNLNTDKYESGDSANFSDLTLVGMPAAMSWNVDDGTVDLPLNNNVTLQVGQEQVILCKAGEALSNGDVVYASGAVGNSGNIEVSKYIANNTIEELYVLGVATEDIANGEFGYITIFGKVRGLSTDGSAVGETWTDGTILYASPTTAGALTSIQPSSPNQDISVAMVVSAHASNGTIVCRPTAGFHLDELHDVLVTDIGDGEVLQWDEGASVWANKTLTEAGIASIDYVDTSISSLVDSAPGALDTLNELAAALGDDANFATTVTNSIATKLPLTGGTITGDLTVNGDSFQGFSYQRAPEYINVPTGYDVLYAKVATVYVGSHRLVLSNEFGQVEYDIDVNISTQDANGSHNGFRIVKATLLNTGISPFYYDYLYSEYIDSYTCSIWAPLRKASFLPTYVRSTISGTKIYTTNPGFVSASTSTNPGYTAVYPTYTVRPQNTGYPFHVYDGRVSINTSASGGELTVEGTTYTTDLFVSSGDIASDIGVNIDIDNNNNNTGSTFTITTNNKTSTIATFYDWGDLTVAGNITATNSLTLDGVTLQQTTGDFGSLMVTGGSVDAGWTGYSVGGRVNFMHNGGDTAGIYNDVSNIWILRSTLNAETKLYYSNEERIETFASGVLVSGVLISDRIRLQNDTTDTVNNRISVYDSGFAQYGMMLWNSNGTTGDWATMIYGPAQADRRISFGKVNNTSTFATHSDITEWARLDLDTGDFNLTYGGYTVDDTTVIDSSRNVINVESLGIGTSVPTEATAGAQNLVIHGDANAGITIRTPSGNVGNLFFADGPGGTNVGYRGYLQYNHADDSMRIGAAGYPAVKINSNSTVEVSRLNGSSIITASCGSGSTITDHHSILGGTQGAGNIISTGNYWAVWHQPFADRGTDNNLDERMRLNPDGNFGIGTGSPTNKFVVSDGNQGFEVNPNASGEVRVTTYDRTNDVFKPFKIQSGSFIVSPAGGFDALIVKPTGEVGIGISDPENAGAGAKDLVVYARDTSANAGITIRTANNRSGNIFFADGTVVSAAYRGFLQYQHSDDMFRIGVAGAEAFRIESDGDVGIGTSTPSARSSTYKALHVESSDTTAGGSLRLQNGSSQYCDILSYAEDLYFFSDGAFIFRDHASNQVLKIFGTGGITTSGNVTVNGTVTTTNYDMEADFAAIYSLLGDVNSALDAINGEVV